MGWDPSPPGALIGEESWGRFRGHLRTYAIFVLLLLVIALGASIVALVDHARLRDGGLQAEARVRDAHERQRGADLIEVVFTDHEGELRHGRIPVVDNSQFEPGGTVTVVYDAADLGHVDVASGGSPLWHTALMVAVGTAILTAWVGVRRSQLRRRVHRAVADGPRPARGPSTSRRGDGAPVSTGCSCGQPHRAGLPSGRSNCSRTGR